MEYEINIVNFWYYIFIYFFMRHLLSLTALHLTMWHLLALPYHLLFRVLYFQSMFAS